MTHQLVQGLVPPPIQWYRSKSKTATSLDSNYKTDITLSLPSAEEKLASDVVFVVDTSQGRDEFVEEAEGLVDTLEREQIQEKDSYIKVGVVQFHGYAKRQLELTELTSSNVEKVKDSISATPKIGSGSNLPAGLAEAEKMLNADSDVKNSRKYVVTISDCKTYIYMRTNSKNPWSSQTDPSDYDTSSGFSRATNGQSYGTLYEWPTKYDRIHYLDGGANWQLPNNEIFSDYINALKNNKDAHKFDEFDYDYQKKPSEIPYMNVNDSQFIDDTQPKRIINIDKSMTQTLDLLQNMSNKGIHYYFYHPDNMSSTSPIFDQFITYLNNGQNLNFENISNDILYLLDKGSKVVDYMGSKEDDYNFDLADPDSMTMTIDDKNGTTSLKAEQIKPNIYGFGPDASITSEISPYQYKYIVEYFPDNSDSKDPAEHIVWTINVPVTNFQHVQLHYTEQLTNPKSQPGTYTVNTNNDAKLYPIDSNEETQSAEGEAFESPQVTYTVESQYVPRPSTPKPSTLKPSTPKPSTSKPSTPKLNITDHYAYIVGYPDNTVHPEGQITRAEAVSIFFRLLTPAIRDSEFAKIKNGKLSPVYTDVKKDSWYYSAIAVLKDLGFVSGYQNGNFDPNDPITRAEFAAIAERFNQNPSGSTKTYSDISGHWAEDLIKHAAADGWIYGYPDGTFRPNNSITRAEAMAIVNRVTKRYPDKSYPFGLEQDPDMHVWSDNKDKTKWYYLDVQEATNGHLYHRTNTPATIGDQIYDYNTEYWNDAIPAPDWNRYKL